MTAQLLNYVFDRWTPGEGNLAELTSAIDGTPVATTGSGPPNGCYTQRGQARCGPRSETSWTAAMCCNSEPVPPLRRG